MCQNKKNQNWGVFEQCCEIYLKENRNSIPMLNQTLISIKNQDTIKELNDYSTIIVGAVVILSKRKNERNLKKDKKVRF